MVRISRGAAAPLLVGLIAGLSIAACSSDTPSPPDGAVVDASPADVSAVDTGSPLDVGVPSDTGDDVSRKDVVADTPDAAVALDGSVTDDNVELPVDVFREAAVDAVVPQEASLDAARDVFTDAPRDAPADATMDAARDVTPDLPRDVASDLPRDVTADVVADAPDAATGPRVDRTSPQLHSFTFRANEADPMATRALGTQTAFLDTRVASRGRLVVYLHGAGAPTTCGSNEHGRLLASWGFHVLGPCYLSDYGVGNCGANIGGCRLEAFEGVDHHPFVSIAPPDSIETRVVRALEFLRRRHPGGDWGYYLDGARPRWSTIVISGISHGASSAGVIGQVRAVDRVVMLSGPLDTGQAWLSRGGLTVRDRYWGLTHTADTQHSGHLAAFMALGLAGAPVTVETSTSPYGGSHRLRSSAMTTDGHGSTQAGGVSPRDAAGRYLFEPAWRLMYGVTP